MARTVLELVRAATEYLARHGVESPRLDAEVLLADQLALRRLDLYVRFDMPLSDADKDRFRARLVERARGVPCARLVGYREFYGRKFRVERRVLIPRPETELLVDAALERLKAWRAERGPEFRARVLELGVGSGCVLATLAAEAPGHLWFGGDVSSEALLAARENAAAAAPGETIDLREGDIFAPFLGEAPFDLVVSNPPYVADDEWAGLSREVREHDPATALRSGPDPVAFLRRIAKEGVPLCAGKARIVLEGGTGLPAFLAESRTLFPTIAWGLRNDLAGAPRVIVADLPPA